MRRTATTINPDGDAARWPRYALIAGIVLGEILIGAAQAQANNGLSDAITKVGATLCDTYKSFKTSIIPVMAGANITAVGVAWLLGQARVTERIMTGLSGVWVASNVATIVGLVVANNGGCAL